MTTPLRSGSVGILALTLVSVPGTAAQEGMKSSQGAQSLTLEQLAAPRATQVNTDLPADLEVPQPPRPSKAASVTIGDVPAVTDRAALATPPVLGTDVCERPNSRAGDALCRQRLESRASQFARARPSQVGSEGRLLIVLDANGRNARRSAAGQQLPVGNDAGGLDRISDQLAGALQTVEAATQTPGEGGNGAANVPAVLPGGAPAVIVLPGR